MASKGPNTPTNSPLAPATSPRAKKVAAPKPVPVALTPPADTAAPAPLAIAAKPARAKPVKPVAVPPATALSPVAASPAATAAAPVALAAAELTPAHVETPVAEPVPAPIKKEARPMEATIENNVNRGQAMFTEMNDRAKLAIEKNAKIVEEMNDIAKGNIEAVVESTRIAAKGIETMGQEAADYGRRSFEQATAAMRNLAAVKSPADFFKMHNDYVRQSFDAMGAETSKNTEAMIKLASDAAQPISNRFAVAAERVKSVAA